MKNLMSKTVIPSDFSISESVRAWAEKNVPQVNIDKEIETFRDYWLGNGKKMSDWNAVLRNWIRRTPKMGGALYSAEELEMRALMKEFTAQGFRRAYVHETPRAYRTAFEGARTHHLPQRDMKCIGDLSTAKRMRK
jgi:hypothetical protein